MNQNFENRVESVLENISPEMQPGARKNIKRLMHAGVASIADLTRIATDQQSYSDLRLIACWLLARLKDKRTEEILLRLLNDPNPKIRAAAARYLAEADLVQAVQPLLSLLTEEKEIPVRIAAVYSLGLLGAQEALETILEILNNKNEDPGLRGSAAEALADIGDTRAIDPLIDALHDESVEVRFWAVFALGEIGDTSALSALRQIEETDTGFLEGWRSIKEEAGESIKQIMQGKLS